MQFPKAPKAKDQALDDRLASLTDQTLAGEHNELTEMNDANTAKLSSTLLRLRAAIQTERPDAATTARIRARLRSEWIAWQSRKPVLKWPRWAFAGALAVLLLVAITALGLPTADALPGTADQRSSWSPLWGILGIMLVAFLIWIDHRR